MRRERKRMKIYTRGGDGGETGLFGGARVPKDNVRVEAYGAVDELNAILGQGVATVMDGEVRERLGLIQRDLFDLGSSLATPDAGDGSDGPALPSGRIKEMEGWIDESTGETPPLRNFIIPGGSQGAAILHVARTVCRRAERAVVRLNQVEASDPVVVQYLNRLSDFLFAMARLENHRNGVSDVLWTKGEE